jgi:hypothetical protein
MYLNEEIKKVGNQWIVYPKKPKAGEKNRKALGVHKTKEEAVAQLRAIEISKMKNESRVLKFDEFINETQNPAQYDAPEGSTRDKKLDKAKKLLKGSKEDKEKAYRLRDKMEAKERNKPGWKNTPRKDSIAAKNNKK